MYRLKVKKDGGVVHWPLFEMNLGVEALDAVEVDEHKDVEMNEHGDVHMANTVVMKPNPEVCT